MKGYIGILALLYVVYLFVQFGEINKLGKLITSEHDKFKKHVDRTIRRQKEGL